MPNFKQVMNAGLTSAALLLSRSDPVYSWVTDGTGGRVPRHSSDTTTAAAASTTSVAASTTGNTTGSPTHHGLDAKSIFIIIGVSFAVVLMLLCIFYCACKKRLGGQEARSLLPQTYN